MKESPKRYINPFLSDEENEKLNLTTNLDDGKFQKSLEPSTVPAESLEKAKELYIDKNVTECQLQEMVKDICVDEGLSHGEMIRYGEEHRELSCTPINGDKHDDMAEGDIDGDKNTGLVSVTEDHDEKKLVEESITVDSGEFEFGLDNTMRNGEEKLDLSSDLLSDSINSQEPSKNGVNDDDDQQVSEAQSVASDSNKPRETHDTPSENNIEENTTPNSKNVEPTTATESHEPLLDTQSQNPPNHHDMAPNSITVAARGGGESSFTMAEPVSGLITYSGPTTPCGSISHRSDGSNSSVRSFAFPILQNEWNSSPVRMVKPDRKQLRKHKGWRQGFMCCGF